jgi:hypothetical protein
VAVGPRSADVRNAPPSGPPRHRTDHRSRQSGKVRKHERRDVHACRRSEMMPEVEAGVHLKQPQATVGISLNVELRNTGETDALNNLTPKGPDVGNVGNLERRACAETPRIRSNLPARELGDAVTRGRRDSSRPPTQARGPKPAR